jgi:hypothetical protein
MRAFHEHWKLSMGDIALAHHQSLNESRRERRAKKSYKEMEELERKLERQTTH